MAIAILFDGSNRVTNYNVNADALDFLNRPDAIVFYDGNSNDIQRGSVLNLLSNVPMRYLKVSGGNLLEMNKEEKDIVDAESSQSADLSVRDTAKKTYDGFNEMSLALRALISILVSEINVLRQWNSTLKQETSKSIDYSDFKSKLDSLPVLVDIKLDDFKLGIKNKIDEKSIDEKPTGTTTVGG